MLFRHMKYCKYRSTGEKPPPFDLLPGSECHYFSKACVTFNKMKRSFDHHTSISILVFLIYLKRGPHLSSTFEAYLRNGKFELWYH